MVILEIVEVNLSFTCYKIMILWEDFMEITGDSLMKEIVEFRPEAYEICIDSG